MTALDKLFAAEKSIANMMTEIRDEFEREGISLSAEQGLILARMSSRPVSIGMVAKHSYVGANVTYNVAKLVEGGFLKRERDEHDHRSILVSITAKGAKVGVVVAAVVGFNADFGKAADRKVA